MDAMMRSWRKREAAIRAVTWWMILSFLGITVPADGQEPPAPRPPAASNADADKTMALTFRDSPIDQVLDYYAELTGRTLLKGQNVSGTINLKSQTRLTQEEALEAIESILAMNGFTLVPMGTKFLKVVQTGNARKEGMPVSIQMPEAALPETDKLISQVVPLKYIEVAEANTLLSNFKRDTGTILPMERTSSLLITDTAANLQRMMEILAYVDQPTEARVETRIYELKYTEATKMAGRLNELIADSQSKEEKPRVAAAVPAIPTPPGVIRARTVAEAAPSEIETALAERGIIQGKVKIVADERTNILIILSRPSNFLFFDKIIAALDRPVDPEVIAKVIALEYAKAEEISSILNEFIGAAKAETATAAKAAATAPEGTTPEAARSQALQEFVAQRAEERMRQIASGEKTRFGELSPNTKILSDKRTNSLLLMGTRSDIAALEDIIDQLDTMLAQVLIEAVILEVSLSKNIDYGVDWLQRSMTVSSDQRVGPGGGVTVSQPLLSFGGGQRLSEGSTYRDGSQITRDTGLSAGALTYYTTIFDLNIDAVIRMAAGSSDARILSTPVILTTDNTEAKIVVGEERPVVTSTSTSTAGQQTSSYQYRNIGINLAVTPRINPARFVTMEIEQSADNVGGFELIDGNRVPVITKREMSAQIAVGDRSTIVLGGLVSNDRRASRVKVPILGDLPLIGTLFRTDTRNNNRTELMVLLTPYVLMTQDEARKETLRLHRATRYSQSPWHRGWSDSELASGSPEAAAAELQPVSAEKPARPRRRAKPADPKPAPEASAGDKPVSHFVVTVPDDLAPALFGAPEPDESSKPAPEAAPEEDIFEPAAP